MTWINATLSYMYGAGPFLAPTSVIFATLCFSAPRLMGRLRGFGCILSPWVVRVLGSLCVANAVYLSLRLAGYAQLG